MRERITLMLAATLAALAVYVGIRLANMAVVAPALPDRVAAGALLAAEGFVLLHAVGFFVHVIRARRGAERLRPAHFVRPSATPVALLVSSFNESEEVLARTLASVAALDYPAVHVYLVDDSTRRECLEGVQRLAAHYGATLVHRENRAGYKAGAINDLLPRLREPYVALLDADQRPHPTWLRDVVPLLDQDPALAFVQVPQVYVETEGLPVAETAKHHQAVFFEYICEGKGLSNAMFCCGSNVVLRREALLSIGCDVEGRRHYFDESTVTEDFATSLRLHEQGWRTAYVNRTYVVGMGPETLAGYFTQQMRWASGTLAVGLRALRRLLSRPRALRPAQWWEYFLSGSYYLIGLANVVYMAAPVAFVAFGVRPLPVRSNTYLLVLLVYLVLSLLLFFDAMGQRGSSARQLWLASALCFATSWIYVKAALVALFGLRRAFGVTPKGVGGAIPWRRLPVELGAAAALTTTALAGLAQMAIAGPSVALGVNTFWAAYQAAQLFTLFFHFNRPVELPRPSPLFVPAAVRA